MPLPAEGGVGHIAFHYDVTSVYAYVTFITSYNLGNLTSYNLGNLYARKLKLGTLLSQT